MPVSAIVTAKEKKEIFDAIRQSKVDPLLAVARRGGSIDIKNEHGQTPLIVSAINSDIDTVVLLLKMGANPTITDAAGFSLKEYALMTRDEELLSLAIKYGKKFIECTRRSAPTKRAGLSI